MPLVPRIAIRMTRNRECRMKNERASFFDTGSVRLWQAHLARGSRAGRPCHFSKNQYLTFLGFARRPNDRPSVFSSLSAATCRRAFVSSQGQTRRFYPAKRGRALQSFDAQLRAIVGIVDHSSDCLTECPSVKWVEQQCCVPGHFRKTGLVSRNHGRAALHGLEHGQAKASEVRRVNEARCAAVERRQILLRNIADELHAFVQTILLRCAKDLAVQPARFSGNDKLRKPTRRTSRAQT